MDILKHIRLLAKYDQWMNEKIYTAAARLPREELQRDRGAFFKSLLGTLNHLVVTDIIWLQRLARHPSAFHSLNFVRERERPPSLDYLLHRELGALWDERRELDAVIAAWTAELSSADLDHALDYRNMKGEPQRKLYGSLVLNLFNHHTHHRGQATTLLSQAGEDVGPTDLLVLIPQEQSGAQ